MVCLLGSSYYQYFDPLIHHDCALLLPSPSVGLNLVQDHMNPMPSHPVSVSPHFHSHQLKNGQTRESFSRWLTVLFFFFFFKYNTFTLVLSLFIKCPDKILVGINVLQPK